MLQIADGAAVTMCFGFWRDAGMGERGERERLATHRRCAWTQRPRCDALCDETQGEGERKGEERSLGAMREERDAAAADRHCQRPRAARASTRRASLPYRCTCSTRSRVRQSTPLESCSGASVVLVTMLKHRRTRRERARERGSRAPSSLRMHARSCVGCGAAAPSRGCLEEMRRGDEMQR
jgi:hypothetical protein